MVKRRILRKIKNKNRPAKRSSEHKKSKILINDNLNDNLEKLYKSLEPTPDNKQKKYETFTIIKSLLVDNLKYIKEIYLYGSFSQNIDTNDSDIDITVICNEVTDHQVVLIEIHFILIRHEFTSRYIEALVPIVHGTCLMTGIDFDISFNHKEGYSIGLIIKNKIFNIPILRPVILIMKHILSINDLNKPYTGGMNSFVLFHLVYAYYKLIKDQINDKDISLKLFLMKFLNFYGNLFNEKNYSILNDKTEACLIKQKLFNSSLEDKIDIQCFKKFPNAAGKCFNYGDIKRMFRDMFEKLCELDKKNQKNVDLTNMFYGTYDSQQRNYSYDSFDSDMYNSSDFFD